jgi:hypothetical protein
VASETEIQQQIRLQCSKGGVRLWRNNSGSLPDPRTGRYVQFGVGSPGGSDLIGYRRVRVTAEMVGQEIAQFAAVEVKSARGRVRPEQQQFIDNIVSAGGIAGIARSVDEALPLCFVSLLRCLRKSRLGPQVCRGHGCERAPGYSQGFACLS